MSSTRWIILRWVLTGVGLTLAPLAHTGECIREHPYTADALAILDFQKENPASGVHERQFVLSNIHLTRQDVFPIDQHWLARQANRFHIVTREEVILASLPFGAGDSVSRRDLAEAERILRDKPYFYDARVLIREICGDKIDVDVVVRDVWTLTPRIGFSRSGGDNRIDLGVSDINLFGLGKDLEVSYVENADRTGVRFRYTDENIVGSRWKGDVIVSDNDDGHRYGVEIARPFYALDTAWATGFAADTFKRKKGLYFENDKLWELDAESEYYDMSVGRMWRRTDRFVDRLWMGMAYERESFDYPIGFPGPTSTLRRFVYPYVAWQRLPDRFIKTTNVDRINRTEDIALGVRTLFKLGWSPEALSNQGDQLLGDAFISGNWYLSEYQLLNARLSFAGRFAVDDGHAEDVFLTAQTTYHWDHHERWGLIARVSYSYAHNLSDDQQLLIGGDSGLRGYPSRYQSGDRRFLVTFEERYYADIFPLRLFRLGFAAFVDIGRAWYEDDPPTWVPPRDGDHFGVLANIGLGLRIESVRTRRDRVIHIDIAKPLVDGPGVGSTELTITVKRAI